MSLVLLASVAFAQSLTATGACPGTVALDAAGLAPGAGYGVLVAPTVGDTPLLAGPCAGMATGLDGPTRRATGTVGADGRVALSLTLPAPACGRAVQLVDATCALTPVAAIPGGADADGDGVVAALDCDDADPAVFPGAWEVPDDGVDADCDGADLHAVPLDDPALRWIGRVDEADPSTRPLHWPGAGVVTEVTGDRVWLELDDTWGLNRVVVYADGALVRVIATAAGFQRVAVDLPGAGPHHLRVTKRTETFEEDVDVVGILVADGAAVTPAPDPAVRFEFYGDSITAGMSALCACDSGDAQYKAHDLTYATLTADAFDGEHTAIALSGLGIERSWWPLDVFDYWDALRDTDGAWDFARWPADVVVINLGQNDYWLGVGDEITAAYIDFAHALRAVHPGAEIYFALGSMDAVAAGSPMPGRVVAAVDALHAEGDAAVHAVIFAYNGVGTHPIVGHHRDMADALIAEIAATRPDLVP